MRGKVAVVAVVAAAAAVVAGATTITSDEFAAFFEIENRPGAITQDHLPYLERLDGFSASSSTYELLADEAPIDSQAELDTLCEEHGRLLTDGKCFLLNALFDLEASAAAGESEEEDGASGPSLTAVDVERVIDGDTIEVTMPDGATEDVRYIGIDTPETHNEVECYGREASGYNERLVADRTVWLAFDDERRDQYDRLLAYVYLDSDAQAMANAVLLSQGFAEVLSIPPNVTHADRFEELAQEAQSASRGLWDACQSGY